MMLFSSVLAFADHASNAIMCRIDGVFRIVCLHHVEQIGDDHVHAVHIESQLIQRLIDGLISLMAELYRGWRAVFSIRDWQTQYSHAM